MVDENIKQVLERYSEHRIPAGGFLTAVLENDLMGAVGRADAVNRSNIYEICKYIYNELPRHIHGSPEAVKKHLEG